MHNAIVQWCVDVCKEWSATGDPQEVADLYNAWTYLRLIVVKDKEKKILPGDFCTLNCHFNPYAKRELLTLDADPFTHPREAFEEYVDKARFEGVNPYFIACLLVNASTINTPVVFRKHMFAKEVAACSS